MKYIIKPILLILVLAFIHQYLLNFDVNAQTDSKLVKILSIDSKSLLYTIDDNIVYCIKDDVFLFNTIQRKYKLEFNLSDFAVDYKDNMLRRPVYKKLTFIDNYMFMYTRFGLTCYFKDNGLKVWNNLDLINQENSILYNPILKKENNIFIVRYNMIESKPPELLTIDINNGRIIDKTFIVTEKYQSKYKDEIYDYAEVIAYYDSSLILWNTNYRFYSFNLITKDIEWISDFFLPIRWNDPKYIQINDLLICRIEIEDPSISIPPCSIEDYYAPGVCVFSLKTGKRLYSNICQDYLVQDNYIYLFKFSKCDNTNNIIEIIDIKYFTSKLTVPISINIKYSWDNRESVQVFDDHIYIVVDVDTDSHIILVYNFNELNLLYSLKGEGGLSGTIGLSDVYRRIYRTDNFLIIKTSDSIDVYATQTNLIELIIILLRRLFLRSW